MKTAPACPHRSHIPIGGDRHVPRQPDGPAGIWEAQKERSYVNPGEAPYPTLYVFKEGFWEKVNVCVET